MSIDVAGRDTDKARSPRTVAMSTAGSIDYAGSSDFTSARSSLASAGLVHLAPIHPDEQFTNRSRINSSHGSQSQLPWSDLRGGSRPASPQGPDDALSSIHPSNLVAEPLVTVRFQHVQTGDQEHYVVVGREGKLTKCEEEVCTFVFPVYFFFTYSQPIRVPGAVQSFGVLVALREVEDEGTLIVRQVSEVCIADMSCMPN